MVYLKIPEGNSAHEDTQHKLYTTNMAEDSVVQAECVNIKSVVEKVYK